MVHLKNLHTILANSALTSASNIPPRPLTKSTANSSLFESPFILFRADLTRPAREGLIGLKIYVMNK